MKKNALNPRSASRPGPSIANRSRGRSIARMRDADGRPFCSARRVLLLAGVASPRRQRATYSQYHESWRPLIRFLISYPRSFATVRAKPPAHISSLAATTAALRYSNVYARATGYIEKRNF